MTLGIKFDANDLNLKIRNSIEYSYGFLDGAQKNRVVFNKKLSDITAEILKRYIDSRARVSPESLHHVYEWDRVGDPNSRLFEIDCRATKDTITLYGKFLPSTSVNEGSRVPFVDKANIMENRISVEIEPRDADVLAFEVDGEPVFTVKSVFVANPGGDEVAGSFGRVVEEFFDSYFSAIVLNQSGIFNDLKRPKEFLDYFSKASKGAGRSLGQIAGRKYMDIDEVGMI